MQPISEERVAIEKVLLKNRIRNPFRSTSLLELVDFCDDSLSSVDGKFYSVSLWRESADRLKLEGCLIKLLCQTQSWQQTLDVQPGQFVGLIGDLNGPRADKEWAQVMAPKPIQVKGK